MRQQRADKKTQVVTARCAAYRNVSFSAVLHAVVRELYHQVPAHWSATR